VIPAGSNETDWLLNQVFDQLRSKLVSCRANTQLAVSAVPETVQASS